MKSKGDRYRRSHCYTMGATVNEDVSRLMVEHYAELCPLISDDITAEAFQDTYCRMTQRFTGGDFVSEFRRVFWNTLRESIINNRKYKATITSYSDQVSHENGGQTIL